MVCSSKILGTDLHCIGKLAMAGAIPRNKLRASDLSAPLCWRL